MPYLHAMQAVLVLILFLVFFLLSTEWTQKTNLPPLQHLLIFQQYVQIFCMSFAQLLNVKMYTLPPSVV